MAFLREYRLKLEITLNGSGFDLPSSGNIKKTLEMPTANITYPNKHGSFFKRFSPRDIIRIYVGRDEVPDEPTFVGYPVQCNGEEEHTINMISRLNACEKEYLYIDEYNNYDGWEVSKVIQKQLDDSDINASSVLKGTEPAFFIPPGYREPMGITRYQLIKFARDLAYDVDETNAEALFYYLHEHGDGDWLFTKQEPLKEGNQWRTFTYSTNLLNSSPMYDSISVINRQTVFTPSKERVTFNLAHDQQININGIQEGAPIELDYGGAEEAYDRARLECLKRRAPTVNTSITHLDLIEAVPGISIVKVVGAPNVVDGLHRVVSVDIDFTGGLKVITNLEKSPPTLSNEIISMLRSTS